MAKYDQWITEEGLLKIQGWARDGLTEDQIAHNMGISRSTFSEWKKRFSELSDTLKRGKEVVDRAVENALYKRALGYEYEEVTQEPQWSERENKFVMTVTKKVKKQVAPDTTAQIFWLKNRKPAEWRDKQEIDNKHDGELKISLNVPAPKIE